MSFIIFLLYLFCTFIRPQEWMQAVYGWPLIYITAMATIVCLIFEIMGSKQKFLARVPQNGLMVGLFISILMSHVAHSYFTGLISAFNIFLINFILFVVIPKFIHCILHDEQPPIFGNGKQSRDFTYIDNVVQANILAMTTPAPKGTVPAGLSAGQTGNCPRVFHEVFNVANGKDNTVLEIVNLLNKIIGKNIQPKFLPVRPGDVFRTCADISKIKSRLGYNCLVGFEEGLKRTVEYFKNKK